jgi:prepilin-type N-terminal cleavage/methylation domain-containing protein
MKHAITHASILPANAKKRKAQGFSLIELMVAVAIVAILAGIALPLYSNYIQTSREGVLTYNVSTIEVFQEDRRLRQGTYLTAAANRAAIEAAIGWRPEGDDSIAYAISAAPGGGYDVTATDADGFSVCIRFPGKARCP